MRWEWEWERGWGGWGWRARPHSPTVVHGPSLYVRPTVGTRNNNRHAVPTTSHQITERANMVTVRARALCDMQGCLCVCVCLRLCGWGMSTSAWTCKYHGTHESSVVRWLWPWVPPPSEHTTWRAWRRCWGCWVHSVHRLRLHPHRAVPPAVEPWTAATQR